MIPEDDRPHAIRIHWDLADLGAAARGVTSFGEGDIQIVAPPSDLYETWIMAGEPSRYPNVHKTEGGGREEDGDEWFIGALPTMAASAWYWEAIDRRGRSVDSLYREAAAFAAGDYANALMRHSDASLHSAVAARVAEYIALPPAFVTEHIDRSRVTTMLLLGPHGIFSDPSTRTAAVTRLRAWIREVSTIQR